MILKLFVIFMIALGETLAIYPELLISKSQGRTSDWLWTIFIITIAGFPLLLGYFFGYRAFHSMWAMMAVSIASILIVEPFTIWLMFHEIPSKMTLVALTFGAIGLIITLFE